MSKIINIIGKKFNKLTVICRVGSSKSRDVLYKCKCDCGKETFSTGYKLRKGIKISCGCAQRESASKKMKKHGFSSTKIYDIWCLMIQRCEYKKHPYFYRYGGRGIIVCDEWKNDFMNFYNWAVKNGYKEGLTIERIDNDGDYCPENCRWATRKEQARNRKTNHFIWLNNKRYCLAEISEKTGINYNKIIYLEKNNKNILENILE